MEKYRLIQEEKSEEVPSTASNVDTTGNLRRKLSTTSATQPRQPASDTVTTSTTGSRNEFPEVRITQQGKPRNYISYAMNLLSDGSTASSKTIVLKAMGRAINKAVTIAEILKRKMPLHQWNELSSLEMIDLYEPIEEGLDVVENRRYVSCLTITLSLTLLQPPSSPSSDDVPLDIHHFGYQPPLPITELQQQQQPSNVASYTSYNKPQRQRQAQ